MNIPGLTEALERLGETQEQMAEMNANLALVVELLQEQNNLIRIGNGQFTVDYSR